MTALQSDTVSPASDPSSPYQRLIRRVREAGTLSGSARILGWDQETMMPPGGAPYRATQLAQLARMVHEMTTDPRIGDWLDACEADGELMADPLSVAAVNVRETRRSYDRATRLPGDLVEELARTSSLAKVEWAEARKKSNFALFAPRLREVVALLRRKAECLMPMVEGRNGAAELWDALADGYEPGCTAAQVEPLFRELRPRLIDLIGRVLDSKSQPPSKFNDRTLPIEAQRRFVRDVAGRIGFDYRRGRLDESTHPFCSGSHCNDTRMTTRFHEAMLGDSLGSTMHESGHGIYNQGLPADHIDEPMGMPVSLGIHESQSRMWENQVGRAKPFWRWCAPTLIDYFGDAARDLTIDVVYRGVNIVKRSFIRVEADEATYNLHIMVRFTLERALLNGDVSIDDLPGAWNELYKQYLDIDVPDDARGCLQDIHWSMAAIGYFPTYTLGNLYAAQFFDKAKADLPGLEDEFARGEFASLKKWLNENIHSHGMRYRAADLCEHVTGEPLSAEPMMQYLEDKLTEVYNL